MLGRVREPAPWPGGHAQVQFPPELPQGTHVLPPPTSTCALEANGFSKEAFSTNPMHTGTHAASHGLLYRTQPGLLHRVKRANGGLQGQVPKRHSPEWRGRRRRPVLGEDACADQTQFP